MTCDSVDPEDLVDLELVLALVCSAYVSIEFMNMALTTLLWASAFASISLSSAIQMNSTTINKEKTAKYLILSSIQVNTNIQCKFAVRAECGDIYSTLAMALNRKKLEFIENSNCSDCDKV